MVVFFTYSDICEVNPNVFTDSTDCVGCVWRPLTVLPLISHLFRRRMTTDIILSAPCLSCWPLTYQKVQSTTSLMSWACMGSGQLSVWNHSHSQMAWADQQQKPFSLQPVVLYIHIVLEVCVYPVHVCALSSCLCMLNNWCSVMQCCMVCGGHADMR